MIRAVKRQVLGAGEPGEVPHPAGVEGIRGGFQEEVMSPPVSRRRQRRKNASG